VNTSRPPEFKFNATVGASPGQSVSWQFLRDDGVPVHTVLAEELHPHLCAQHSAYCEIHSDFGDAVEALNQMKRFDSQSEQTLRRALFSDAIITYCRAFTSAEGRSGVKLENTPHWIGDSLSLKRHEEMMDWRNTLIAHTGNSPLRAVWSGLILDSLENTQQIAVGFQKMAMSEFSNEDAMDTASHIAAVANRVQKKIDFLTSELTKLAIEKFVKHEDQSTSDEI
jgi:hypothetical protein